MLLNVTKKTIFCSRHINSIELNFQWGSLTQIRNKAFYLRREKPKRPKPIPVVKYEAMAQSLKAKGYLRPQNPYTPPKNVAKIVDKLKTDANLTSGFKGSKFSIEEKFLFLQLCSNEFNHTVPNSVLHEMETINDVVEFYLTPINTYLPLDELLTKELPPNLHIEQKYTRFTDDSNAMFNGKTAFPGSSTIVTGIRARQKYQGFKSEIKLKLDEDPK